MAMDTVLPLTERQIVCLAHHLRMSGHLDDWVMAAMYLMVYSIQAEDRLLRLS
jgi:hypothetical protein